MGFASSVFRGRQRLLLAVDSAYLRGSLYNPLSNSRWNTPFFSFDQAANFLGGGMPMLCTVQRLAAQP